MQDAIFTVLLTAWIGGMATPTSPGELGRLLTLEQVGEIFQGIASLCTTPRSYPC